MSGFRIFKEILEILFGIGCIVAGIVLKAEDPWLYIIGVGLIAWAAWDISKEVRDSSAEGDVSDMSKQREEIEKKLGGEE